MLPRWLWATLVASLVLALSVVSRPAFAMPAGLCDDRGASAIAPVPALEAFDQATWLAPPPCGDGEHSIFLAVAPSQRAPAAAAMDATYALMEPGLRLARAQSHPLQLSLALAAAPQGVRWRVERPPRR